MPEVVAVLYGGVNIAMDLGPMSSKATSFASFLLIFPTFVAYYTPDYAFTCYTMGCKS
jgi:hypothetical protein